MRIKVSDQESWDAVVKIALLSNNALDIDLKLESRSEYDIFIWSDGRCTGQPFYESSYTDEGLTFNIGTQTFYLCTENLEVEKRVKGLSSGKFVGHREFSFNALIEDSPRKYKKGDFVNYGRDYGKIVDMTYIGEALYLVEFSKFTKWITERDLKLVTKNGEDGN